MPQPKIAGATLILRAMLGACADRRYTPLSWAEKTWGPHSRAALALQSKANVGPIAVGGAGAEFGLGGDIAWELAELLAGIEVLGRLQPTPVPFLVRFPYLLAVADAVFRAQGTAIPAVAIDSADVTFLERRRIGRICSATKTLLETRNVEELLQNALLKTVANGVDSVLTDSTAGDGVRPAGLLHGITPLDATGVSSAADVTGVVADLITALYDTGSLLVRPAFVCSQRVAIQLSQLRTSAGDAVYPGVNIAGGQIAGIPLIAGPKVSADTLILLDGAELLVADDGLVIEASDRPALELSSAPAGDAITPAAAVQNFQLTWQQELLAMKVVRYINWKMRRPFVVAAENFIPPAPSFVGSP